MKRSEKTKVNSKSKAKATSQEDPAQQGDLCHSHTTPFSYCGLAHVSFETHCPCHPCITENLEIMTTFRDLSTIEGMPDPKELLKWLVADEVLVYWGGVVGFVPELRYVQEGLFICSPATFAQRNGDFVEGISTIMTPKGVMWLKENYVPTPERHRCGVVPEDLIGVID